MRQREEIQRVKYRKIKMRHERRGEGAGQAGKNIHKAHDRQRRHGIKHKEGNM